MSEYDYLVTPGMWRYETRHAAVGAAAVYGSSPHVDTDVVPIESGSDMDHAAKYLAELTVSPVELLEGSR